MQSGKLIYLMGASGAGKDSLIEYAEHRLQDSARYKFVRRHITRSPVATCANRDIFIASDKFDQLKKDGFFALSWERYGIRYGITAQIESWLQNNKVVIINGSRHFHSHARKIYPNLHTVEVSADPQILRRRLQKRERETAEEINERMSWTDKFSEQDYPESSLKIQYTRIENNGPLAEAGEKFLDFLKRI